MQRRKFLWQMAAGASLVAGSQLFGEVVGNAGGIGSNSVESLADFPISHGLHSELSNGFLHPPETAEPRVFWVWLGIDTTPAAMTYDLEQMKAKGIAGFILYGNQAGSMPRQIPKQILVEKDHHLAYEYVKSDNFDDSHTSAIPFPPLPSWTPLWRERIRYVARESARLGLKFCSGPTRYSATKKLVSLKRTS